MKHCGRRLIMAWVSAFAAMTVSGCVATGYSDGAAGVDVGYVGGFYEPYGFGYGGWDRGYRVGPPRGGVRGRPGGGRGAPSIPRGPRGGSHGRGR
jgi:hypothetical protein